MNARFFLSQARMKLPSPLPGLHPDFSRYIIATSKPMGWTSPMQLSLARNTFFSTTINRTVGYTPLSEFGVVVVRTGTLGAVPPLVSPLDAFLVSNTSGPLGLSLVELRFKQPKTKRYIRTQGLFSRWLVAYPYGLKPSALHTVID